MISDSPIDQASRGAVKGLLDWPIEKVLELANKFKNGKLKFIQNPKTIELVRDQINRGDWGFYQRYIKSGKLRIIIWMGLTLRDYAKAGKDEEIEELREKIYDRFKTWGLHVAEFAQTGLITKTLSVMTENMRNFDETEVSRFIENLLKNIERQVFFVSEKHSADITTAAEDIRIKITSGMPDFFVITSYGSAKITASRIIKMVEPKISGYSHEIISSIETLSCFFSKK